MTITSTTINNLESDITHIAEVAVGKVGGSVGGASIDTSTDRLGQVKKTLPKILEEMQDVSTSVESHNNNPLAHGMTTHGAAIVQAATVADQRAALGLDNHHLVGVDARGFANNLQTAGNTRLGNDFSSKTFFGPGTSGFIRGDSVGYLVVSSNPDGPGDKTLYLEGASSVNISAGTGWVFCGGHLGTDKDNFRSIGAADKRWGTAYFSTNPVISSDARLKTDIAEIPGAIAADIMQLLRPVTFRYKVGGQEAYEEEESFEDKVQVTEPVEMPKTTVQIIDGKAVQVTTTETVQQPVYDEYPLVDGDGKPVMQLVTPAVLDEESGEEITPAVYVQAVHREPRLTTVTKTRKVTKYREVEGRRYHAGYIAQEVKAALDAVADRWPPAADLAVWLLSDTADADSTQMVRMEQMTPILHAAMVYQWQQK